MKKLIPFLLSLTTILANAQYNRIHSAYPHNPLITARTATTVLNLPASDAPAQKLPYFLRVPSTGTQPSFINLTDPMQPAPASPIMQSPIQGSWLKPWTPPSLGNRRFQSVQSFDMQRNVSDSKATYQFTKRR